MPRFCLDRRRQALGDGRNGRRAAAVCTGLAVAALALGLGAADSMSAEPACRVLDIFGRDEGRHGLVLVDWEGYMANPTIRLAIRPPRDARYPARLVVRAREPRLYFDLPSEAGPEGPKKEVALERPADAPLAVSIFPDRNGRDENHELEIEFRDATGKVLAQRLPIHVVDCDRDSRPIELPRIIADFSQDRTGFFRDEAKRAVVEQAASDWASFFDWDGLDRVPAGDESTFIWDPDGFRTGRHVKNAQAYAGFWLYAYGIDSPLLRSGGEPSRAGGLQSRAGEALAIRRSGGLEVEVKGNYNRKGWLVRLDDADWWKATNLRDPENDLYSIVHHEMGHALAFNPANRLFDAAKRAGRLTDDRLSAYLGHDPKIDRADHFDGTVDPASLKGAFGNEYHGRVPLGRWLITKLDLLCAQAAGHRLRATSAFAPVELRTHELIKGKVASPYKAQLHATGSVPFFHWDVTAGALPDGLTLDSFTGEIAGTPKTAGEFEITVRVRDYDERGAGASKRLTLTIADHGD